MERAAPLRHSLRSRHLSRKRARNEDSTFLARLRERWIATQSRDGEGTPC